VISLFAGNGYGTLTIDNDGRTLSGSSQDNSGMGMQIMNYRARMIGGSLKVESGADRGVTIQCIFPLATGKEGLRTVAYDH
jgi:two-component system CheB/CheR fusion protein